MEEASKELNKVIEQASEQKGGLKTLPLIIVNESIEKLACFGLQANMIFYLMREYHMDMVTGTSVISLWSATINFLPIVEAFISDSFLGRYGTIAFGSISSLLGMTLLWLTTMTPQVKPPHCDPSTTLCKSATPSQLTLLFSSFMFMAIGAGGIRSCSLAFGADQLEKKDTPRNNTVLQSYISWYYASASVSVIISMSVIVYIQDQLGWKVGFGVPAALMLLSTFKFLLGSSSYVKVKPNKSLLTGFAQVIVAAFKNRILDLPCRTNHGCYHYIERSDHVIPTEKLRFLNKACIITNPGKDLKPDGSATNPWSLCTIEQVEELKSLMKVIPLWSTGVILAVAFNQQSFSLLQANTMDRHITSHFRIPAASFSMFSMGALMISIAIYDRLLLPQLAKVTGRPYGLGLKQRMGMGLVLSCFSTAISEIVECVRRRTAIKQGFINDPQGELDMSAMWLVPQYCLTGIAEAFNGVGQLQFFYCEFPKSMSCIAIGLFVLGSAFGNLIAGFLVKIVDDATKIGRKESWVSSNLNRGHYDYYYWLLTFLGVLNLIYFLICSWGYGPCDRERVHDKFEDEDESVRKMLLSKSRGHR